LGWNFLKQETHRQHNSSLFWEFLTIRTPAIVVSRAPKRHQEEQTQKILRKLPAKMKKKEKETQS
jgi:hypothetical protein